MKPSVLPGCQCLQKDISGVWILSHQRMHPKIHWHELSFFGQLDTVQTCMRLCRMSTQTWWNITQILFSHMKHSLLPVCSVSRRLSKEFWSCQINVYIKKEKIWKDQIWWPVAVFCKLSGLLQNRHEAQNSLTIQKVKKKWREFSYRQRQIQGQQISDFENICWLTIIRAEYLLINNYYHQIIVDWQLSWILKSE